MGNEKSNNDDRKFVQLNLDKTKPNEKKIAEYIENKYLTEKIKNKSLLMQALQEKMESEEIDKIEMTEATQLKEDIAEIKSMMKMMLHFLMDNTSINIVNNEEKKISKGLKVGKMEITEIDEDEMDI